MKQIMPLFTLALVGACAIAGVAAFKLFWWAATWTTHILDQILPMP